MKALVAACKGSRRDEALVRLMLDTGVRRAECAGIMLADLDLSPGSPRVLVHGKGSRDRHVPLGDKTVPAVPARACQASPGQPGGAMARPARRPERGVRLPHHHQPGEVSRPDGAPAPAAPHLLPRVPRLRRPSGTSYAAWRAGRPWAWPCATAPQRPRSAPRRAPGRGRSGTGCEVQELPEASGALRSRQRLHVRWLGPCLWRISRLRRDRLAARRAGIRRQRRRRRRDTR